MHKELFYIIDYLYYKQKMASMLFLNSYTRSKPIYKRFQYIIYNSVVPILYLKFCLDLTFHRYL